MKLPKLPKSWFLDWFAFRAARFGSSSGCFAFVESRWELSKRYFTFVEEHLESSEGCFSCVEARWERSGVNFTFVEGRLEESAKGFSFVEAGLESFRLHSTFVVVCSERPPSRFVFFWDVLGWLAGVGQTHPARLDGE